PAHQVEIQIPLEETGPGQDLNERVHCLLLCCSGTAPAYRPPLTLRLETGRQAAGTERGLANRPIHPSAAVGRLTLPTDSMRLLQGGLLLIQPLDGLTQGLEFLAAFVTNRKVLLDRLQSLERRLADEIRFGELCDLPQAAVAVDL